MANVESFYPEDTAVVNIETYTKAGALFDPTSVKVTIYDPNGTEVVSAQDATNDETGKWHYDYDIPAAPSFGIYTIKGKGTDGARVKSGRDTFEVKEFRTGG